MFFYCFLTYFPGKQNKCNKTLRKLPSTSHDGVLLPKPMERACKSINSPPPIQREGDGGVCVCGGLRLSRTRHHHRFFLRSLQQFDQFTPFPSPMPFCCSFSLSCSHRNGERERERDNLIKIDSISVDLVKERQVQHSPG